MAQPKPNEIEALKLARLLTGRWWVHSRPADPETYVEGIADALAEYPLAVATECCDVREGLARVREQPPTIVAVVKWCDARVDLYRALVNVKPRRA